jgi:diaminopimelate epimerase
MTIQFYKYQATGNDFVILDNRDRNISFTPDDVKRICDRKFGVGADGLMLIEKDGQSDFSLVYYNSDGSQSLCGNGSRAAVLFASRLGILSGEPSFLAYDGPHTAQIASDGQIHLRMNDVFEIRKSGDDFFIHTGSPHYIRIVKNVEEYPVYEEGKSIRYSEAFSPAGTNVNFVELQNNNRILVRTYERGVENETLSCGTGVTAAALAASHFGYTSPVKVRTLGGDLAVEFDTDSFTGQPDAFSNIYLIGPAKMVFSGELEL